MHVLTLGAAGMIGRKLTERLVADTSLGRRAIERMTLIDIVTPQVPAHASFPVSAEASDFAAPGAAERMLAGKPDIIFHLAAIVSGEAEADFDKGLRINLDGTRHLLDAIRSEMAGQPPRVVFTSSIAVFGAPFPEAIPDSFHHPAPIANVRMGLGGFLEASSSNVHCEVGDGGHPVTPRRVLHSVWLLACVGNSLAIPHADGPTP